MTLIVNIILGLIALSLVAAAVVYHKTLISTGVRLRGFAHEVRLEMKRVAWPTRDDVVNLTIMVTAATVVMMLLIGAIDAFFGHVVSSVFHFE